MARDYNDVFKSLMYYVSMKLDDKGNRVLIRNPQDLRLLIRRLDERRRGGKARISERLIDEVIDTRAAQQTVGKTIGRRGRVAVIARRGTITKKYKQTLKNGTTRIIVRVYDAKTGKVIREERQ